MGDVIDFRLVRFARTLRRLVGDRLGVMLVPELETGDIRYWHDLPDRLLCGREAFDVLVIMGFRVLEPCMPPPPKWPSAPLSDRPPSRPWSLEHWLPAKGRG